MRWHHSREGIVQSYRNPATVLSKIQYSKVEHIFLLPSCEEGDALGEKDVSQMHF